MQLKRTTTYSSLSVVAKQYKITKDNNMWATLKYKHALRKNRELHHHKDFVPIKKCKVYLENDCSPCTAMQAFWFVVQIPKNNWRVESFKAGVENHAVNIRSSLIISYALLSFSSKI